MEFKAITVNTAENAEPHIGAEDDAALYSGIIGTSGILNIGSCMAATVENSTLISLADGAVVNNGRYGRIPDGRREDFVIEAGAEGQKRIDLIVCRYTNEGSSDSLSLVLVPGTAGSTAAVPDTESGDLVLYKVRVDGFDLEIERTAPVIDGLYAAAGQIAALAERIDNLQASIKKKTSNVSSIKRGHNVVTIPSGRTSVAFLDGITGMPTIVATNGNGAANTAHITGVTIIDGTAYATFEKGTIQYGLIQINYTIIE